MAAFYFGSDTVINEETGEEYTTEELIAIGKEEMAKIDAEMFAAMEENEEKMADTEAVWGETNDLLCEEVGYSPSQEVRTTADLIAAVSGEDINGIDGIAYRQLCEELMNTTMMQDREVFYRTGEMVGTVRPWGWGI